MKKKKSNNTVVNVTKISRNIKNWLNIGKILQNKKKHFVIIIEKYFKLQNFASLKRKIYENFFFCAYL